MTIHTILLKKLAQDMEGEELIHYSLIIYSFIRSGNEHKTGPYRFDMEGLLDLLDDHTKNPIDRAAHVVKIGMVTTFLVQRHLLSELEDGTFATTELDSRLNDNMKLIIDMYEHERESLDAVFDRVVNSLPNELEPFRQKDDNTPTFDPSLN
jgi:hypothetical protein